MVRTAHHIGWLMATLVAWTGIQITATSAADPPPSRPASITARSTTATAGTGRRPIRERIAASNLPLRTHPKPSSPIPEQERDPGSGQPSPQVADVAASAPESPLPEAPAISAESPAVESAGETELTESTPIDDANDAPEADEITAVAENAPAATEAEPAMTAQPQPVAAAIAPEQEPVVTQAEPAHVVAESAAAVPAAAITMPEQEPVVTQAEPAQVVAESAAAVPAAVQPAPATIVRDQEPVAAQAEPERVVTAAEPAGVEPVVVAPPKLMAAGSDVWPATRAADAANDAKPPVAPPSAQPLPTDTVREALLNQVKGAIAARPQAGATAPRTAAASAPQAVAPPARLEFDVRESRSLVGEGEQIVMRIAVRNVGGATAERVTTTLFFADGIEPVQAIGHAAEVCPGEVRFATVPELSPGSCVDLLVTAVGTRPGSVAYRGELACGQLAGPIAREGAVTVQPRQTPAP